MRRLLRWAFNGAAALSAVLFVGGCVTWCRIAGAGGRVILPLDRVCVEVRDTMGRGSRCRLVGTVDLRGRIPLPYLGRVSVAGVTPAKAEERIARAYRDNAPALRLDVNARIEAATPLPWVAVAVAALLPCARLAQQWRCSRCRRRRARSGQCLRCGYDLTGNTSGVCSECGAAVKAGRWVTA